MMCRYQGVGWGGGGEGAPSPMWVRVKYLSILGQKRVYIFKIFKSEVFSRTFFLWLLLLEITCIRLEIRVHINLRHNKANSGHRIFASDKHDTCVGDLNDVGFPFY